MEFSESSRGSHSFGASDRGSLAPETSRTRPENLSGASLFPNGKSEFGRREAISRQGTDAENGPRVPRPWRAIQGASIDTRRAPRCRGPATAPPTVHSYRMSPAPSSRGASPGLPERAQYSDPTEMSAERSSIGPPYPCNRRGADSASSRTPTFITCGLSYSPGRR